MNWTQSTFVKNCPVYLLTETGHEEGKPLARIEYLLDKEVWIVEVLNGYGRATIELDIDKVDEAKKFAIDLLETSLISIQGVVDNFVGKTQKRNQLLIFSIFMVVMCLILLYIFS